MPELTVSEFAHGSTIEDFLQSRLPAAPSGYLRQLVRKGRIRNGDQVLESGATVHRGDCIRLPQSQRILELLEASNQKSHPLDILFESREILIVNKPSGVAVHTGKGHEQNNLTDQIADYFLSRKEKFQVSPIQRLDLETSGPVLFGKGKKSCSELGQVFMSGEVNKIYLALVKGKTAAQGTLVSELPAKGKIKYAASGFRTISANKTASLVEVRLETGRQHQIRRQFSETGHPLFGDRRYRGPCPPELSRLFLHCSRLSFTDPFHGQQIDISCPLPDELLAFLEKINLAPGSPRQPTTALSGGSS